MDGDFNWIVGAPAPVGVAKRIVGAGLPTGPPLAVLSGIVGAGAGAGPTWAVGGLGTEGAGGTTGGAED